MITENKSEALNYYKKGFLVWFMYFDGSGLIAENEDDILNHDEDGYYKIEASINVYNDGELVFTGDADEFVSDNDNDEDSIIMVNEAIKNGEYTNNYISGEWTVKII